MNQQGFLRLTRFRPRRGVSITELMVSMIVVAATMAGLAQLVSLSAQQQRSGEARRLATMELANQAERVAALAWEDAAPEKFTGWEPSAEFAAAVASPTCKATVTEEAGEPASRRIRLEVGWAAAGGSAAEPMSLTVWKYPAGGEP